MKILIVFIVLLVIPVTYGWNCQTHKYICDKAGFEEYDCCIADNREFQREHKDTTSYFHHCTNNKKDCQARDIADNYLKKKDADSKNIALHLLADSMVPVHWWSTDYEKCHAPFENLVDQKIYIPGLFDIEYKCELKNGSVFKITMDKRYLDHVSEYIQNYTSKKPAYRTSEYLKVENCSVSECGLVIPYKEELLYTLIMIIIAAVLKYFGVIKLPKLNPKL